MLQYSIAYPTSTAVLSNHVIYLSWHAEVVRIISYVLCTVVYHGMPVHHTVGSHTHCTGSHMLLRDAALHGVTTVEQSYVRVCTYVMILRLGYYMYIHRLALL